MVDIIHSQEAVDAAIEVSERRAAFRTKVQEGVDAAIAAAPQALPELVAEAVGEFLVDTDVCKLHEWETYTRDEGGAHNVLSVVQVNHASFHSGELKDDGSIVFGDRFGGRGETFYDVELVPDDADGYNVDVRGLKAGWLRRDGEGWHLDHAGATGWYMTLIEAARDVGRYYGLLARS